MRGVVLAAVALTAIAGPASAQDSSTWTLTERDGVTIAHTTFQSRVAVVARCADRQLSVLLQGVPTPTDNMMVTAIVDGSADLSGRWWLAEDGNMLLSRRPATFARGLAEGRTATISGQNSDGRPWTVEAPLPQDRAPLDAVLQACDVPLSDPRDRLRPGGRDALNAAPVALHWERMPTPEWPDRAFGKGLTQGVVVVTCITGPAGALRDCRSESELPVGGNFGREAVRAANEARLSPDTPVGALVEFDVAFFMR